MFAPPNLIVPIEGNERSGYVNSSPKVGWLTASTRPTMSGWVGWLTGFEPATSRITTERSTE